MPQGLEVYRSDATAKVSLTDRVSRVAGTLVLTASGSVTVDTTKGTPYAIIVPNGVSSIYSTTTISGGTISWTAASGILIYGVY